MKSATTSNANTEVSVGLTCCERQQRDIVLIGDRHRGLGSLTDGLVEPLAPDGIGVHERRAREWFGWRPARNHYWPCPRIVAGKRCRWKLGYHNNDCLCRKYRMGTGWGPFDHARLWLAGAGEYIGTGEPYELNGTQFAECVADCSALGLNVSVSGASPYWPGKTTLIIFRLRTGLDTLQRREEDGTDD